MIICGILIGPIKLTTIQAILLIPHTIKPLLFLKLTIIFPVKERISAIVDIIISKLSKIIPPIKKSRATIAALSKKLKRSNSGF